jgi:type I restriction enzyme S subunit
MGSEAPMKTLGEVCYITDGAHAKVERQVSGVMYLTSKNIGDGQLKLDSFDFISNDCFSKLFTNTKRAQRRLQTGDVLMGIIGTFGNCYVYKDTDHFGISSSVAILRPDQSKLLPEYLYYYISSASFKAIVEKFKGGSVQGYTNIATLKALPIPLPSVAIQKAIVENLIPLDDKITLNRQINQTLEQMAQTLFKSWFVDFDPVIDNALDAGNAIPDELQARAEQRQALRNAATQQSDASATPAGSVKPLPDNIRQLFPNEFEESELGWVPKGWGVSTAGDELTIKGGSTPSTKNPEFWEGGDVHWTSPKDLSGKQEKVMLSTERKITKAGLGKITSGLLPAETVLMSSRAPVGYLALTKIPVAINQGYIAIPESESLTQEFILYWLDSQIDMIKSISGGTTFAEISKKTFRSIPMVIPSYSVVDAFSKTTSLYLSKISINVEECNSLSALRDSLLPKLISGELELI